MVKAARINPLGFPFDKIGAFFMIRATFVALHQTELPAGFLYTGDLALVSKLAEADTANAEFAEITVRSAANLAAVVFSGGELLISLLL